MRKKRRVKKEQRQHKEWKKRREINKERVILERKCFVYRGFWHIAHNCRNMKNRREKRLIPMLSNKFKVLKNRVMNIEEGSRKEIRKDRKIIEKKD